MRQPDGDVDAVRFFVDGTLLRTITSGPPYAVEWLDADPFDRCELAVEAEDSQGRKGRASIVLEPFEVTEASEVTSVLLEAGVYDRKGHFVGGLQRRPTSRFKKTASRRRSTWWITSVSRRPSRC